VTRKYSSSYLKYSGKASGRPARIPLSRVPLPVESTLFALRVEITCSIFRREGKSLIKFYSFGCFTKNKFLKRAEGKSHIFLPCFIDLTMC